MAVEGFAAKNSVLYLAVPGGSTLDPGMAMIMIESFWIGITIVV